MSQADRTDLARDIVSILPRFGQWASGFRDFDTPWGRVGFRQLAILWALRYRLIPPEEAYPSRFAQLHEVQPSVVTRALAKLEAGAFIERVPNPNDARSYRVVMTEQGRDLSIYVERLYLDDIIGSMAFLDQNELEELHRSVVALSRIVDDLERKRVERSSRLQGRRQAPSSSGFDGVSDDSRRTGDD